MTLNGAKVLVTRPAAQAETLCRMIEAEGGEPLRLPLVAIEPVANPVAARQRLAAGHDLWIFTSANAARHAAPLIAGGWPPRVAAIGPATAAALSTAPVVSMPLNGASSTDLLDLPELRRVEGQKILVVTGEGGLKQVETELAARGAHVERAEVYRRVALPYPADAVAAAVRKGGVIVVTSGEALEHLLRIVPAESQATLKRKPLVLPSARVVEQARNAGFTRAVSIDEPMSDAALLAACVHALELRP